MPQPLVILTGASRGFGRSLALAFAHGLRDERPAFVLFARNTEGLAETVRMVTELLGPSAYPVITHAFDMADLDAIEPALHAALAKVRASSSSPSPSPSPSPTFSRVILINNAGSLGDQTAIAALPSVASLRAAIDVNVVAPAWLTSLVLRALPDLVAAPDDHASVPPARAAAPPSVVVNISSLAAVQPFKTQGVYCLGKAARDMLHATVAAEADAAAAEEGAASGASGSSSSPPSSSSRPLKTLNYAPGPLDTDMNAEIRSSATVDPGTRSFFAKMKEDGTFVDVGASAEKCARLVAADRYKSGAHIDFFDPEP